MKLENYEVVIYFKGSVNNNTNINSGTDLPSINLTGCSKRTAHRYFRSIKRQIKHSNAVKVPHSSVCIPTASIAYAAIIIK